MDVYVYGMTVLSTIHRCSCALKACGGYAEISDSYVCPGGEGMNAAMLLSGLGVKTKLAGPHWGSATRAVLERYAARYSIDVSEVTRDDAFEGLRDLVIVAGTERTVLGWFGRYFAEPAKRWDEPNAGAIRESRVAAIDPYFGSSSERAGRFAREAGTPYVPIDCAFESELHAGCAVNVVSQEYRRQKYAGEDDPALFRWYTERSHGLTVFTSGSAPIRFGRAGEAPRWAEPWSVDVKSTLGAGDSFRAGMVYAILQGYSDPACVRFASALAALMCTRLPIADNVPSSTDVEAFLRDCSV